nr:hypothetical protein [Tanacetum cinerariifolium]
MEDRVMLNNSQGKKQEVEDHRRNVKLSNNKTSVTACNDSLNAKTSNVNFICVTCGKCVLNDNHDKCILHYLNGVNSRTKMPMAMPISTREPKCIVNQSVATSLRRIVASESTNQKPRLTARKLYEHVSKACSWWYPKFTPPEYKWKPKSQIGNVNPYLVEIILFIVDSRCSKHMTGNLKLLTNFVEKFMGLVKFSNDQIAPILGYGDLNDIVIGHPKLKFFKDHLCSSCELEKAKRKSFQTKTTPSSKRQLQLLYMDLCGPMRVESINGKKYVLLESDGEMYMFALTVSRTEPKNIREAMVDSACIESMQEELHQFDRLDEEVYVNQPDGFVDPYHPNKVYRLKKALYGLKQAPRVCKFEMSMMVELKFFLGIQIYQSLCGIFINQAKYAQEILIKHGMTSCDSIGTPMATKHLDADLSETSVDQTKYQSMEGALMYLTTSRPDIVHATCYCARYQAKPIEKHIIAVKRIFWYLKDTIHMGLWYLKDTGFELTAFSDSNHAGCLDSRKSTSGGIQFLGGDKLVSWSSKNQDCTTMSSAEAEYVSLSTCCAQVLWLRTQLTDYGFYFDKIPMYCESKAAIAISCNPVQHSRTKHIDVRYHFIKEKVENGIVELLFVETEYQLADLFTKALSGDRFKYLISRLGMRCLTPEELKVLANESA